MEDAGRIEAAPLAALGLQNPSRSERRDQQTRRILDAAKACFRRHGFQGASMHQICAEAGMSPGALYRYFESKEAIVEAISEEDRRQDAEVFRGILTNPDVVEGMTAAAMVHIRHMHENGTAGMFAEICAESMRNPSVEGFCRKNMEQVAGMFGAYLGDALERGEIDPPVGLDVVLPVMLSIAHGMALNDLPAKGVPLEKLEILLRATAAGMLRPTGRRKAG